MEPLTSLLDLPSDDLARVPPGVDAVGPVPPGQPSPDAPTDPLPSDPALSIVWFLSRFRLATAVTLVGAGHGDPI